MIARCVLEEKNFVKTRRRPNPAPLRQYSRDLSVYEFVGGEISNDLGGAQKWDFLGLRWSNTRFPEHNFGTGCSHDLWHRNYAG